MSTIERRSIQRVRFRKGQSLRSVDFRDQLRDEAHLRWWHNRAIHQAYGVYEGFHVEPLPKGRLRVHPGKAYDASGREIMLTQPVVIDMPQPLDQWVLIARYLEPDLGCGASPQGNGCLPGYRPVDDNGVELFWKPSDEISYLDGVLLMHPSRPDREEVTEHPYLSRPYSRPRIVSGSTLPELTAWSLWFSPEEAMFRKGSALAYQTEIDISPAGFQSTPCVFAWPGGPVWELGLYNLARLDTTLVQTHVENVSPTRFTFRLIFNNLSPEIMDLLEAKGRMETLPADAGFFVTWLGIQHEESQPIVQRRKSMRLTI